MEVSVPRSRFRFIAYLPGNPEILVPVIFDCLFHVLNVGGGGGGGF
jgi:hypothetical protein